MFRSSRSFARPLAALGAATVVAFSFVYSVMGNTKESSDPFAWLEDVEGERALT